MGGSNATSETVTTQELSPEQRSIIDPTIPIINQFVQNPPTSFPGSTVAPTDPLTTAGQTAALGSIPALAATAQGGLGAQAQLQGATGAGRTGLDIALGQLMQANGLIDQFSSGALLDPSQNPGLQGAISAATSPIIENFQQSTLPGIRSEAISAGQFGGTRQGIAEGLAAQGAQREIGDISSGLANQAFQSQLGASSDLLGSLINAGSDATRSGLQTGVAGLLALPQTLQAGLLPASILEGIGLARQGQGQAELSDQVQRFQLDQIMPFLAAQQAFGLGLGLPGGPTTSVSEVDQGSPGLLRGALGGLASGLGVGGPIGGGIGSIFGALLGGLG